MNITSITIIHGHGPDRIALHTTLPSPGFGEAFLSLDFQAPDGKEYVERNFPGVPVEIIGVPKHEYHFSKYIK